MKLVRGHDEYLKEVFALIEDDKLFEAKDRLRKFIKEGQDTINGANDMPTLNLLLMRKPVPLKPDSYNYKYVTYAINIARNILGDLEERTR